MKLVVNGEEREVGAGTTLAGLLDALGLAPERVVVERNGEVVVRERFAQAVLEDGDRLELVRFVGGG